MAGSAEEDLLADLVSIFGEEAEDRLFAMNRDILALEQARDPEQQASLLTEIFRNAHTLKGSAAIVHLDEVTAIAHGLESVFDLLQRGALPYEPSMFDLLYAGIDALAAVTREALTGEPSGVDVAAVTTLLEALVAVREIEGAAARDEGSGETGAADLADPARRPIGDSVRVASAKLDALMAQVGELLVARIGTEQRVARLRETIAALKDPSEDPVAAEDLRSRLLELQRELETDGRRMAQLTAGLQDDVRRTRMLPVSTLFEAFPRMVRDLAHEQEKDIDLAWEGGETEVDRSVLEQLRGPLTHLIRNAVDHGIEPSDHRRALGKPARGTIELRASQRGSTVQIEVEDDGRGIDADAIRESAVARGVLSRPEADALGFSTRSSVTEVSGRGVGMDAVRDGVERMQGMVAVEGRAGRGALVSLTLPLTVATTRCLLVRTCDVTVGIPTANVSHILRAQPSMIETVGGRLVLRLRDGPVPLVDLGDAVGLSRVEQAAGEDAARAGRPVVVLRGADRRVGLAVDDLRGAEEVVIKPLPAPLTRIPGLSGVTILGTGEVVIVVAAADLLRGARTAGASAVRIVPGPIGGRRSVTMDGDGRGEIEARSEPITILVADDSFMTRTLAKNILESAGYRVHTASDGLEAWTILTSEACDLVLSDVQMPGMDGVDLTVRIRGEERFRDLPVILLTSLDSREESERGLEAGADAYLTKGSFEQVRLLEAIRRLT